MSPAGSEVIGGIDLWMTHIDAAPGAWFLVTTLDRRGMRRE